MLSPSIQVFLFVNRNRLIRSAGDALAQCLQESDCIMVQRQTPQECLGSDDLPMKCQQLRKGFSECKCVPTINEEINGGGMTELGWDVPLTAVCDQTRNDRYAQTVPW